VQSAATTDRTLVKRLGQRFESARRLFHIALSTPYLAAKAPIRTDWRVGVFNAAVAALFLNALQHASQTLVIGKHTPGVVSALSVSLPYSVYALHRLGKERLIAKGGLCLSLKRRACWLCRWCSVRTQREGWLRATNLGNHGEFGADRGVRCVSGRSPGRCFASVSCVGWRLSFC
jgi:hypothetical protein